MLEARAFEWRLGVRLSGMSLAHRLEGQCRLGVTLEGWERLGQVSPKATREQDLEQGVRSSATATARPATRRRRRDLQAMAHA